MNLPNIYVAPTGNTPLPKAPHKGNGMNTNNFGHTHMNKKHKGTNNNEQQREYKQMAIIFKFQNLNMDNTTFQDILKNVCELSKDSCGSRLVQKQYEECRELEKEKIIHKVLPDIYSLSKDIFGNYVVQRKFIKRTPRTNHIAIEKQNK